jgi:hypothetical protein
MRLLMGLSAKGVMVAQEGKSTLLDLPSIISRAVYEALIVLFTGMFWLA